jgi:hypothetical protein
MLLDNNLKGPYPIFCRGHSGGRLVCEAFIRNQIAMGQVSQERKDTEFFNIHNPLLRELILNAYRYLHLESGQQCYYQNLLISCIKQYHDAEIRTTGAFGWKMGIMIFTLPVLLDAFPTAKVIHLIRDGRDVMLSRLEARFGGNNLADSVNKLVVFGDATVDNFEGLPLTPDTVTRYRNELEMLHWVTAVRYGLIGRNYPQRYLEVKYEELCQRPVMVFKQIFDFLELPFLPITQEWLVQAVHQVRIGKWQQLSPTELVKPLQVGQSLLRELGYMA